MTRILVIEDDPFVRTNIIDMLKAARYDALAASNGRTGLQLAQAQLPDLVISDIAMPELSGYEVLEALRKDSKTATIPVILLTAKSERADQRKGMELGADDYVTKPYTTKELLKAVNAQLKKRTTVAQKYESTLRLLRKNIIYALPHELHTPLHLIKGFAEVLQLDYETLQPDDVRKAARSILKASQRLQRLTQNYLVYAQIEVVASDPKQLEALRNHIIRAAGKIIADEAQQKATDHQRQSDLNLDLCNPALRISEQDLRKIVAELVDNAFKFSTPGTEVYVKSIRNSEHFMLSIRDLGRGMSAEDVKNIGAYMQFDRTFYEQQGLGLGFIIARRLVQLHGGELHVKSELSKGTLVGIRFPF